ncbi:heme biosynthesis HemY N-terminal domain-containing protein [Microvirga mediterraneensis]|uniref:Heme biosynthesis protein HemY n=1 Tax=Microvirga mediterraneensis TaxID=2754695 RepID=A0A838BJB8_9HYPH|nr:heme biosynthesis HemY N-terminal domain-containing protein [Microvirga mediterraneensis]MBA1155053.1 heme biosynthesis protein HemY [Microvirga mediterraneensis]
MWRALVFIGLLCVAAFGAVWLADRPGTVLITFGGYEIQMSVAVAAIALAGLALALALLWSLVTGLIQLPSRLTFASRARRRSRGYQAVSRGMVAVGAGDTIAARRYANEAERLLGKEPLTLLLKAQAAQVSGNREVAEAAFLQMMDEDETRVLGLRGLFVEARRRGDAASAHQYASEAVRLAPAAAWASDAVLEARCADGDWRGALETVERRTSLGLLDKKTARRHQAVLLTADALERVDRDPDGALRSAQDAVKLAPDLVPAAALAGRLLSRKGDLRKAAKVVETAWRSLPHPDLADVYLNLRPGDSGLDRLKRAETLSRLSNGAPEGRLAVARSALEAREFDRARDALEPLLRDRPSMRVCLLMSDLEQAEHGSTGKGREWLARATRAPRDPAWIADGVVSDHWAPVSPVTGRLDAFVWQAPPDVLIAPELTLHDDVTGDLDDEVRALPITATEEPAPAPASEPVAAPASEPLPTGTKAEAAVAGPVKADAKQDPPVHQPEPVVFPATPPDVPKPEDQASARRSVFSVW